MEDKRFALLIDSDNISAKYIACIIDEMMKYGIITYKRIYGDWTSSHTAKWRGKLLENSITPIQQFSNTFGKNSTDSALIIDAMDILYTGSVEGFCIVSSDSDFTRLASRLRESGMTVIGMGEEKTPRSFRAACSIFTNLEILIEQESDDDSIEENIQDTERKDVEKTSLESRKKRPKKRSNVISKESIENDVTNIITENENKGKNTDLSEIGNRLVNKYPDFDVRNYGYTLLSKFFEDISSIEMIKENNTILVKLKDNEQSGIEIIHFVEKTVADSGERGIDLGELSNIIHLKYKKFNVRDYGYTRFSKFVQSIDRMEIGKNGERKNIVYYK